MMRKLTFMLLLLWSSPALCSSVLNISTDEMVLSSPSIVVGVVRGVQFKNETCTERVIVQYDVERALRGPGGGKGTYVESTPIMAGKDCPSVHFFRYPCAVNWKAVRPGERVIFYRGGSRGDACDAIGREAEIKTRMSKRLTIPELIDKLRNDCPIRGCPYMAEIARYGDQAIAALKDAVLNTKRADRTQIFIWALADIRRPATCDVLKELLALGDDRVPARYVIEAMGSAGCTMHLPEIRRRFAAVTAPDSYDALVLLSALAALRDRDSTALIVKRLNEPAWSKMYLSLVFALDKIGDKRAIAPLCERLARGRFAYPVERDMTRRTLAALGGKCSAGSR